MNETMKLKIVDGVKKRITATPSKKTNNRTETSVNYINICLLKYLNDCIIANTVGGGLSE